MKNLQPVTVSHCTCSYGTCSRLKKRHSDGDCYEPCEPRLKEDGLPWFYFIPSPAKLVKSSRRKYIRESEKLWGKEHWRRRSDA